MRLQLSPVFPFSDGSEMSLPQFQPLQQFFWLGFNTFCQLFLPFCDVSSPTNGMHTICPPPFLSHFHQFSSALLRLLSAAVPRTPMQNY